MQNNPAPDTPAVPASDKKRHGCLTAWLILIIIINVVMNIIDISIIAGETGDFPSWGIAYDIVMAIGVIVCAIAIFRWKKWGFYGFIAIAVIQAALSFTLGYYFGIIQPFIAVAVLYGVLNIGKENKGWPQLE